MSVSKSRAPKGERKARDLGPELLPNPGDYFASARYIDRRAELGDFTGKGKPASALGVLHYLWRHTIRIGEHSKLGPFEIRGYVLSGKSKVGKIATECGISYNAARTTLMWLAEQEWLDLFPGSGQVFNIRVKMDLDGHNERMTLLGYETVPTDVTVTDEPCQPLAEGVTTGGTAPSTAGTVPANEWHTQQGSHRDLERESYSSGMPTPEDQPQHPGGDPQTPLSSGKTPSEDAAPSQEDLALAQKKRDEDARLLEETRAARERERKAAQREKEIADLQEKIPAAREAVHDAQEKLDAAQWEDVPQDDTRPRLRVPVRMRETTLRSRKEALALMERDLAKLLGEAA